MAEERRDVYLNPVQQRIFYAGARDVRVVAARRFGKTAQAAILAHRAWYDSSHRAFLWYERGRTFWLGQTTQGHAALHHPPKVV